MRISDWSSDVCSSDLFPSHDTISIPNGYTPVEIPTDMNVIPTYYGAPTKVTIPRLWFYPITQYWLELKPMQGVAFATEYNIPVSKLTVPEMINLAAWVH